MSGMKLNLKNPGHFDLLYPAIYFILPAVCGKED